MSLSLHTAALKHVTPDADKLIAEIARVSNPDNQGNHETAPRLIAYLIKHRHWSPFQMASMCIDIDTTRPIGRQILRHLSAIGYQEFSGRYAVYGSLHGELECRFQHPKNRQLSRLPETDEERAIAEEWNAFIAEKAADDERAYQYWLSRGVAKEQVRGILPEGLVPTRMYLHFSIRTWIHYIQDRTAAGVQREHRWLAYQCRNIFAEQLPMVAAAVGFAGVADESWLNDSDGE
jgi:thymidylate synthase (FAD)